MYEKRKSKQEIVHTRLLYCFEIVTNDVRISECKLDNYVVILNSTPLMQTNGNKPPFSANESQSLSLIEFDFLVKWNTVVLENLWFERGLYETA